MFRVNTFLLYHSFRIQQILKYNFIMTHTQYRNQN